MKCRQCGKEINKDNASEVLNRMGFPKNWKELMTIERGNKING